MNAKNLKRMMDEAVMYPPQVRIAAALHLDGMSEEEVHAMLHGEELRRLVADPLLMAVYNHYRDIKNGLIEITPRLEELAKAL